MAVCWVTPHMCALKCNGIRLSSLKWQKGALCLSAHHHLLCWLIVIVQSRVSYCATTPWDWTVTEQRAPIIKLALIENDGAFVSLNGVHSLVWSHKSIQWSLCFLCQLCSHSFPGHEPLLWFKGSSIILWNLSQRKERSHQSLEMATQQRLRKKDKLPDVDPLQKTRRKMWMFWSSKHSWNPHLQNSTLKTSTRLRRNCWTIFAELVAYYLGIHWLQFS